MGTWDTSLYGGDLPLDIKDEYYEQLYEGHTPEEAAALVWKELQLGEEDIPVFRLVLADVQWKLGQMTEDTLRNVLEVLDSGAAMAEWEGTSESDRRSRQRVLDRLRKKLESPQGPLKTVKRPKPKKFKYKIGDVIAVRFVPELAEQNPDIESYCNKYFMVQVVGYTDYPTSLSRHPLIEQCGGVVALDWMGDTIPDMEEFAKAPMLDLTVLWWPIRSFAVTTMFGANAVQCTVIGNTEIKFEQDVPERVTMLNEARTWKYVVLDIVRAYQKQHPQNNT
ncbi:hypothetical protein [Flavonifractor plautii]|uniref:hypothetical protein n=1 Tax=Flavonifractor plautii TaxID=292800 RepID=UPI0032193D87